MSGINSFNPKSSLGKIGYQRHSKEMKPIRIMVLGHTGVGKTASVVRFITRRFIGDYDTKEHFYTFNSTIDNEVISFEVLDSIGLLESETVASTFETNIRWAEAFILMYSVTDKCSFEEVNRFKFLINYNKRRRKLCKDDIMDVPVVLVANKTDQFYDRMVTPEEGLKRSQEIGCACFHEISVRESVDEVKEVFRDVCRFWRFNSRFPKLKRSKSDSIRLSMTIHSDMDPEKIISLCCDLQDEKRRSILLFGRTRSSWQHDDEQDDVLDELEPRIRFDEPFRSRAKTDGNLLINRAKKWRIPSPILSPPTIQIMPLCHIVKRRNSISMRGHVSY